MDSARQVIRFGIPGTFAMLWAGSVFAIAGMLHGDDLNAALAPLHDNFSTLAAVIGSVPVGWACYQVYYALYGPLILGGLLVRRDRGFEILAQLAPHQLSLVQRLFAEDLPVATLPPYDLKNRFGWRPGPRIRIEPESASPYEAKRVRWGPLEVLTVDPSKRETYAHLWRVRWEIVSALVNATVANDGLALKHELTHLSDIYHGIGAARAAMWIGSAAGIAGASVHAAVQGYNAASVLGATGLTLVASLLWGFGVLHRVRRRTWVSACSSVGRGLRLYFAQNPTVLRDAVVEIEGALNDSDDAGHLREA